MSAPVSHSGILVGVDGSPAPDAGHALRHVGQCFDHRISRSLPIATFGLFSSLLCSKAFVGRRCPQPEPLVSLSHFETLDRLRIAWLFVALALGLSTAGESRSSVGTGASVVGGRLVAQGNVAAVAEARSATAARAGRPRLPA
jgi:hypothetical protein